MTHLEFMGHVLSAREIGPADVKVKAVVDAREPRNAGEVRPSWNCRMKERLRTKVWWPGIDKDVQKACKTCHGCQLVSQPSKPEPLTCTELPFAPWQHLAADLLGPLPSGDYVFVVVDYYSRLFRD